MLKDFRKFDLFNIDLFTIDLFIQICPFKFEFGGFDAANLLLTYLFRFIYVLRHCGCVVNICLFVF